MIRFDFKNNNDLRPLCFLFRMTKLRTRNDFSSAENDFYIPMKVYSNSQIVDRSKIKKILDEPDLAIIGIVNGACNTRGVSTFFEVETPNIRLMWRVIPRWKPLGWNPQVNRNTHAQTLWLVYMVYKKMVFSRSHAVY